MSNLNEYVEAMKRDWNARAQEDAKWFINLCKRDQTEAEFDNSCLEDVHNNIVLALPVLAWGRDPRQLRLLEIGCGIGRMSRQLAGIFGEVHGVDVAGEMILQARERLQHLPNAHFHETSGVNFTAFPDNHFDVIFSAYVFQHIPAKAAIVSNLRDAFRVLAPGGIFKFVVSGVSNAEYDALPKDTWTGAALTEEEVRLLAVELGAQVISVSGQGTQYCWTLFRKPDGETVPSSAPCRLLAAGRADDITNQDIPSRGEAAMLSLRVTGLAADELDCYRLNVEWANGLASPLCYAAPPLVMGTQHAEAIYQLNARVPAGVTTGEIAVRLRLPDERTSDATQINVIDTPPPPPVITQYSNGHDGGVDIYASGSKSEVRVFAYGFEEGATIEETRMHIGELALVPSEIKFLAVNGAWQITAALPPGTPAQATAISVSYQGRRSVEVPLTIK